jgi:hypothetical protein
MVMLAAPAAALGPGIESTSSQPVSAVSCASSQACVVVAGDRAPHGCRASAQGSATCTVLWVRISMHDRWRSEHPDLPPTVRGVSALTILLAPIPGRPLCVSQ